MNGQIDELIENIDSTIEAINSLSSEIKICLNGDRGNEVSGYCSAPKGKLSSARGNLGRVMVSFSSLCIGISYDFSDSG